MMQSLGLIVACDKNKLIGLDNKLPWRIKEEMSFFKSTTINNVVIMGYNTYLSLQKPLSDRLNIVLTSKKLDNFGSVYFFNDINMCLKFCEDHSYSKKIFIIGGESVYKHFLDNKLIDYMYISIIKKCTSSLFGKISYFPIFDENEWNKSLIFDHDLFEVYYYKKK